MKRYPCARLQGNSLPSCKHMIGAVFYPVSRVCVAGKTESTKLVLLYISEVLMSDTGFSDKVMKHCSQTPCSRTSLRIGDFPEQLSCD
eukprot:5825318-Amphidinium_carterae.1